MVRNSAWKDITQEIQSNTLKCPPPHTHTYFCFIPEGTSVPDVEEIQDSKRTLNIPTCEISSQSRFSTRLVPSCFQLQKSLWCDLAKE